MKSLSFNLLQESSSSSREMDNGTVVTEFILTGLSNCPAIRFSLFVAFLLIYLITLSGNGLIFIAIGTEAKLHNPIHFFLSNLSLLDICWPTATMPEMLENFLSESNTISFTGCMLQLYFLVALAGMECCLLAAMAYDRYMAICHPLRYTTMMSRGVCLQLSTVSWLIGVLVGVGQTTFMFTLPYCGPNRINHFFCDLPPLLKLACADTYRNEIAVFIIAVTFVTVPFLLILVSYVRILHAIFSIPSAAGRSKTFSTCSSHLIVVTLFFGSSIVMYLRPKSRYSLNTDKLLSLFYSVVSPMLNPLIYSLRNKEVKEALRRVMARKIFI
nr:olfactory receptor 10C1-like [Chrysemys picta bellii]